MEFFPSKNCSCYLLGGNREFSIRSNRFHIQNRIKSTLMELFGRFRIIRSILFWMWALVDPWRIVEHCCQVWEWTFMYNPRTVSNRIWCILPESIFKTGRNYEQSLGFTRDGFQKCKWSNLIKFVQMCETRWIQLLFAIIRSVIHPLVIYMSFHVMKCTRHSIVNFLVYIFRYQHSLCSNEIYFW